MASEFNIKICTPSQELVDERVSEVILPSFDGEMGVLPAHEDYVALLGTGVLKLVKEGNDYWFMVGSGVVEVKGGNVTVLAEVAESAKTIDVEIARNKEKELEPLFKDKSSYAKDFPEFKAQYDRARARIEVHRRTHLVN